MKKLLAIILLFVGTVATATDWEYISSPDEMTGKPVDMAFIESSNSLDLGFPYKGKNHGTLAIRRKNGIDVMFKIEKGQILCDSYHGCSINIKFDEKPPQRFRATTSADHSRNLLFLKETARFITEAQKVKQILVQPLIYEAGEKILIFYSNHPLQWKAKK